MTEENNAKVEVTPFLALIYEGLTGKDFLECFQREKEERKSAFVVTAATCYEKAVSMVDKSEARLTAEIETLKERNARQAQTIFSLTNENKELTARKDEERGELAQEVTRLREALSDAETAHARTRDELMANNIDIGAALHSVQNELEAVRQESNKHASEVARLCRERDNLPDDLQDRLQTEVATRIRLAAVIRDMADIIRNM